MKIRMALLLTTVFMSLQTAAQNGKIAGKVADELNQPVTGAIVEVFSSGIKKAGTISNDSGLYTLSLAPGKYELHASYAGYGKRVLKGIVVKKGKTTKLDITFTPNQLEAVTIQYVPPLVNKYDGKVSSITSEDIKRMPNINTGTMISASSPGIVRSREGDLNAGGGRTSHTVTYIDGISVRGAPPADNTRIQQYYNPSEESYKKVTENDFMRVKANPLSTMSIDVDRASYSNVRRFLNDGQMPLEDAVRVEEMINYFKYNYPQPKDNDPIAIVTELTDCPWNRENKLLHIGMQGKTIDQGDLPASNLVFLIDVSGSMDSHDKLPLLISSMKLLVNNLRAKDRVSIVVYAGSAGLVLPATPGNQKNRINEALEQLRAGGSTAGGAGIQLAYNVAQENFIKGGNNRIILATDGDFNVGINADNELETLITKEREKGVFLSCLGFGTGNYKDSKMEMLADKGNGNYSYIDNLDEGRKTLVSEFGGTIFTIAKDVKAQIEFNPQKVQAYRLIGYENRMLNEEDFKDDKKDAGELGSGHTVTFIYELVPTGVKSKYVRKAADLKYQERTISEDNIEDELATIKFRYKKPDGAKSKEMAHVIKDKTVRIDNATENARFSYAVALFGMLLKKSEFKGNGNYELVLSLAKDSKGEDEDGYRSEFVRLVKMARENAPATTLND